MTAFIVLTIVFIVNGAKGQTVPDQPCWGLQSVSADEKIPDIVIGTIIGKGPVHFLTQLQPDCHSRSADCRPEGGPYLVPGDRVVIVETTPGFYCVDYVKRTRRSYSGWMPSDRIKVDPVSNVPLTAWKGTWRDGSTTIKLTVRRNELLVDGDTYYIYNENGGAHFGTLNYVAVPQDNRLSAGDEQCRVKMLLTGDMLFARDNRGCGASNVVFTGKYIRKPR